MVARNTTTQNRHRAYLRRSRPPCHLCGGEIDYSLHWRDPLSFVVDHVIPLARGGEDTRENTRAAHRHCNRQKSDKLLDELAARPGPAPRIFVTERTW
ncbi:HNH endonuclease [Nocardia sp. NPDC057227]|uniref:HNH endonuclease n=1 Tax=Nocardia sp. NPDC057227 TaxID=3346056 RepID=UPI00362C0422